MTTSKRQQHGLRRRDFLRAVGGGAVTLVASDMLQGCGGGNGSAMPLPKPTELESASKVVQASQGGIITLPSGTSITFPGGVLPSDQTVTVTRNSALSARPINTSISGAGPSLAVSFAAASRGVRAAPPAGQAVRRGRDTGEISIHLQLSQGATSNFQGSVPGMAIITASGPVFVGLTGGIDSAGGNANLTLPASLLNAMQGAGIELTSTPLEISLLNTGTSSASRRTRSSTPTMLSFVNGEWGPLGTPDPSKRTLLLVHGVLSDVQTAFGEGPGVAASAIQGAGGYQQILGFDYPWWQPISTSGDQLATLLTSLANNGSGLRQLDIEAHSLGTVVSLAALASPKLSCIMVENLIMLGGPINGTPAADQGPTIVTAISNVVDPGNALLEIGLQTLLQSSSFADVTTTSVVLPTIRKAFTKQSPNTKLIFTGGTHPRLGGSETVGKLIQKLAGVTEPFDGLIPISSALGTGFPMAASNIVQVSPQDVGHQELEANQAIISGVGNQVMIKASRIAVQPDIWMMAVGDTVKLIALPQDPRGGPGSTGPLTWSSNSPAVADVTPCGIDTAKGVGTAQITVTDKAANLSGSATIQVTAKSTPPLFDVSGNWKGVFTSDNPAIGSGTITASLSLSGNTLTGSATVVILGQAHMGTVTGNVEGDTLSAGVAYDTLGAIEYSGHLVNLAIPDIQGLYAGTKGNTDAGTFNLVKQ